MHPGGDRDPRRRGRGGGALMPFLVAGHPDLAATEATIEAIAAAGAQAIELGIPFSDPIADGPVIAEAMHAALRHGATPEAILAMVRRLRAGSGQARDLPIIAMVSISIVDRIGRDRFVGDLASAGIDGLIVPDLDLDEAPALRGSCDRAGISFALLIAPTTPQSRAAQIAGLCSGFVYVLARTGITGERGALPAGLPARIAALRAATPLPLAVGFGISTPEQVRDVLAVAEGAIVGSALVRRIEEAHGRGDDVAVEAARFVELLVTGASAPAEAPP
ncbi:MAG TPA: tryptophan synthase subunit alpha [Phycisphaerales bacterium]|nr:tryptophan synthase subunit alpha [Phycisphaerales bacterium]HMP37461.1 tryptophan synthase subunit alpha [Phycisphaerales bacterium]